VRNLSNILIEIAEVALCDPDGESDPTVRQAALLLASVAWNREAGGDHWQPPSAYGEILRDFGSKSPDFRASLVSPNEEEVILHLRAFKRSHYPDDGRLIKDYSVTPEGRIDVRWKELA